ncbi:hypothetical protein D9619_009020 [Psilocybe cf. subviscida]|uniref:DUF6533 domain-containing protein n=1 Tax=Psilocybe cf. subviscida TaxID=2480587 RepID=A0A8H5BU20_9AGAR|nr:hypothetical protein D9619_009020 [Psilocybe cf. subviscida]
MDVATMVREGNAVNLVGAACLTVLIYDHILCLETEISKMWPTRWSLPKILYCINRYPVVAMLLFNCISASRTDLSSETFWFNLDLTYEMPSCVFYLRWLTVTVTVSTTVVQGILVLRVWALYRNSGRWPMWLAYFFYFGGTATLFGLVVQDYVGEDVKINDDLSTLPGCYATSVPSIIAGFWISPLIVETVLFLLVVKYARVLWLNGLGMPRIFTQLARDSTVYFVVVFGLLLANFLMFQLGPPFLSSLLVTPSTTAGCILTSHMILNMRSIISNGSDSDDDLDNADGTVPNESIRMSTRRPSYNDHLRRGGVILPFTKVGNEANSENGGSVALSRERKASLYS